MSSYTEYYTIVYRNDQRIIILNDNAKPTSRPRLKLSRNDFYVPVQTKSNRRRPNVVHREHTSRENNNPQWSAALFRRR